MWDELEYHPEDYRSLTSEYWCDLLSKIEVKDERKRAVSQIEKIASDRESSISCSNKYVRMPRNKKARTGVFCSNKLQKNAHKHHGTQRYCVL